MSCTKRLYGFQAFLPASQLGLGKQRGVVFSCLSVCKYQQSPSRAQVMFSSRNIKSQGSDTAERFDPPVARGSCFPPKEISVGCFLPSRTTTRKRERSKIDSV